MKTIQRFKRIFRIIRVELGKQRYYERVSPAGKRYIYDYINNELSIMLRDIAIEEGYSSLEEAMKSDIFQQAIKKIGCDINILAYTLNNGKQ